MDPVPAPVPQNLPGTTLPQDAALLFVGAPMADAAPPPGPASAEGPAPAAYSAQDTVAAPLPASGSADLAGDVGPHDAKSHRSSPTDEAPKRAVPEMFQGTTPKSGGTPGPFGSRTARKPPSTEAFRASAPAPGLAEEADAQARDEPLPPQEEEPASASSIDARYAALPVLPSPPAAPAADDAAAASSAPPGDGVRQWQWDGWDATVDHQRLDSNVNIEGYWVHRTRFNTDDPTIWHYISIDAYNIMFQQPAKGGKYGKGQKSKTQRASAPYHDHGHSKGSRPAGGRQAEWPTPQPPRPPGAPRRPPAWNMTETPGPPETPAPKARPTQWQDNWGWRGGWHQRDRDRWR